jgi:hypothetical protein
MSEGKPRKVFKKIVWCLFSGLGPVLLALSVVALLGPAWHLIHGDTISHLGWKIRVPKGFCFINGSDRPTMWKFTFGIPLRRAPYGHIDLFSHADGPPFLFEKHYRRFAYGLSRSANEEGFKLTSERTLSSANSTSIYCLEFARSTGRPNSMVGCFVDGSTLAPFYRGDKKYVPDFYAMLHGMSLETRPSVRSE